MTSSSVAVAIQILYGQDKLYTEGIKLSTENLHLFSSTHHSFLIKRSILVYKRVSINTRHWQCVVQHCLWFTWFCFTDYQVWVHEGVSLSEDDYELCAKLEKIPELSWMPSSGYFGVTAATGGLSDDHDVLSFIAHTLEPLEERKEEVNNLKKMYNVHWNNRSREISSILAELFDHFVHPHTLYTCACKLFSYIFTSCKVGTPVLD